MQEMHQATIERDPSSLKTVLIVESNLESGYKLAQALKKETPYRVVFATNAFQAFQMMQVMLPDVIVMASHFLKRGGFDLMAYVRAFAGDKPSSIVLIDTPLAHEEIAEQPRIGEALSCESNVVLDLVKDLLG